MTCTPWRSNAVLRKSGLRNIWKLVNSLYHTNMLYKAAKHLSALLISTPNWWKHMCVTIIMRQMLAVYPALFSLSLCFYFTIGTFLLADGSDAPNSNDGIEDKPMEVCFHYPSLRWHLLTNHTHSKNKTGIKCLSKIDIHPMRKI